LDYVIICLTALVASGLTFFSGFGLGTILSPVFALFFPIELAIALTAIVHFLNNIFKLFLVGRSVNAGIILRFGIPSLLAAFLGAWVLTRLSDGQPLTSYYIGDHLYNITILKVLIAVLLLFFVLMDLVPKLSEITFDRRFLVPGGLISGFFGGLSGNQGALRSAFLIKAGLSKEAFIATGVVVACMVDVARLSVYSTDILKVSEEIDYNLVAAATLSAFVGAFVGSKLIKKITIKTLQTIVAIILMVFAVLLGLGII
jgi:uncharacterized membrane protein YfcA